METKRTLISVVIPNYNRAETVGQAIDSILKQRVNAEVEIIIGDDCSTDNAREVLLKFKEQYPGIIHLIFHEENIGLGANWATCIKACRGKYICNCDNDDYWHNPENLQIQLDYMEAHADSNVLITNHRTHNRTTGEIIEKKAYIDRSIPLVDAIMRGHTSWCNATIMYRASFLFSHLNLEDFIKYRFTLQDWNAWALISPWTDFDFIPDSTATFGIETTSITRPESYEKLASRMLREKDTYHYVCNHLPSKYHYSATDAEWDRYKNDLLLSMAFRRINKKNARVFSRKANAYNKKRRFASNPISFYAYCFLARIKRFVKKH